MSETGSFAGASQRYIQTAVLLVFMLKEMPQDQNRSAASFTMLSRSAQQDKGHDCHEDNGDLSRCLSRI